VTVFQVNYNVAGMPECIQNLQVDADTQGAAVDSIHQLLRAESSSESLTFRRTVATPDTKLLSIFL
jgi:hypothetical protein